MSWHDFLIIYVCIFAAILAFRCIPVLVLKGRNLPEGVSNVLGLIPAATFAALVTNDLFSESVIESGAIELVVPVCASIVVALVARKTRSLLWSIIAGVAAYALFAFI
jgi:branched-subunit amino acid transport protein